MDGVSDLKMSSLIDTQTGILEERFDWDKANSYGDITQDIKARLKTGLGLRLVELLDADKQYGVFVSRVFEHEELGYRQFIQNMLVTLLCPDDARVGDIVQESSISHSENGVAKWTRQGKLSVKSSLQEAVPYDVSVFRKEFIRFDREEVAVWLRVS